MLIDFKYLFSKYKLSFNGVLHVGANIGEEAPIYRDLGIHKQIWIEANADLIPKLKENVLVEHDKGHKYVFNVCAGEVNKQAILHISNNAGQSSSVLELGTHLQVHPDVHYTHDQQVLMCRLDEMFDQTPDVIAGVDLLNLDVQGAELMVLRGLGSYLRQFKAVYTEVNKNQVYKGCAELADMDLFMIANGFRRVELFNSGGFFDRLNWSDAFYIR